MSVTDKALKVVAERPNVPAPLPPPLFAADVPVEADAAPLAAFLAELALHGAVATPLCIGLFGAAGTGKSTLLHATLAAARRLGAAAREAGLATPFVAETVIVPVTLRPGLDPATAILDAVHDGLAERYPGLASEAAQAHDDPHAAVDAARDHLDHLRQRLDGERRRLDDLTARQTRLTETVLFESSGSQVDAYARAHRGRIDRSLRGFGFGDDTMTAYKGLVRDRAEQGGGGALGWLPALWVHRGQIRLLVAAAAFFVLFWLLGALIDNQGPLLDALRGSNERVAPLADWLSAHAGWLVPARQVAGLAGLAALAMNALRALRFSQPVARGARLLRGDVEARRRDLDGLVAHQAQRVETLARDAEQAATRAAQAEDRLARHGGMARPARRATPASPRIAAQAFVASLGATMTRAETGQAHSEAPARLLVALDGFGRLPGREAAAALDAAHDILARAGVVILAALDRTQIADGFAETDPALATASLDRIVQVPVALSADSDARAFVQALLRPVPRRAEPAPPTDAPEATHSALDKSWLPKEAAVLEALAPFVGETPRAVKRFLNLYRVARADPTMQSAGPGDYAALALGLALQARGVQPESLATGVQLDDGIQPAWHAAATALGTVPDLPRDSRGFAAAKRYAAS